MELKKKGHHLLNVKLLRAEKSLLWKVSALCLPIEMPSFGSNNHQNACKPNYWPFHPTSPEIKLELITCFCYRSKRQMLFSMSCCPVYLGVKKIHAAETSCAVLTSMYVSTYANWTKRQGKDNWWIPFSPLQLQVKKKKRFDPSRSTEYWNLMLPHTTSKESVAPLG